MAASLRAQLQLDGNNFLEYSQDLEIDTVYFENWTDISLSYANWRIGARYEFHLPPQPYSRDSVGQGISQRFLEYQKNSLSVTVGNFYSLFGRGLVLRSFENRMLRWDTNIDGVKFQYYHPFIDFEVIGGRPRDRRGRRRDALEGGSFNFKPSRWIHAGGSLVSTNIYGGSRETWGSLFGTLYTDWGSFYAERAVTNFPAAQPEGDALYLSGNLYRGPFTFLAEYKDYDNFDLTYRTRDKVPSSEITYNNPPTAYREHLYTLMNRHQLVQNPDNEKGYLLEMTFMLPRQALLTLSHSHTENQEDLVLYEEYYAQIDWDPSYDLGFVAGAGWQENQEAEYLNFVGSSKMSIGDYTSLKAIYEHQQVKIEYNDRQYYNQLVTLSLDRAPEVTFSFLGERSTDQLSDRDYWLAGQVDVHFLENFDLTLFGGSRREGKICIGGICIFRPPFEGIELRLINRF